MNFPSQIFFNDINHGCRVAILKKSALWLLPFYTDVSTYCYYKKVRRTMRTAIVSYVLNVIYQEFCLFHALFHSATSEEAISRWFGIKLLEGVSKS